MIRFAAAQWAAARATRTSPMRLQHLFSALVFLVCAALPLRAQDTTATPPTLDSIVVLGNSRLTTTQILGSAGLVTGQIVGFRDVQRAISALFRTGQFDDVTADYRTPNDQFVLILTVVERPILEKWTVRGPEKIAASDVRDRIKVIEGKPIDRAGIARARAAIDSMYKAQGYYAAKTAVTELPQPSKNIRVVFDVNEGNRVAISQVSVDGNQRFSDKEVVKHMATRPEGFFWWQKGRYDDTRLDEDLREHLPRFYGDRGYIDFQVRSDSLQMDSTSGKAILHLGVDEGKPYSVGTFEINGNRYFSRDELLLFYPFGIPRSPGQPRDSTTPLVPFSRTAWDAAGDKIGTLYRNNGYIYVSVTPSETRRTGPDGNPYIDLSWNVREGSVATVNKIDIVGNDVTHERVIREAVVLLPGDVFSQERLIRSYQNIANLGFFQQPMPFPSIEPSTNGVDVDITFRLEERRTGNFNFGASLGQGTGVGGFFGIEEPNLFGRGKRVRFQWQFGRNINDFTLSYTDPAIRDSRISGTVTLFNSRQRFTVGDLGRRRQEGGNLQLGFPFLGSRYTRIFASYGFQRIKFTGGSSDLRARFNCNNCSRSTVGATVLRDTRIGLPFATAGTLASVQGEVNGGFLGGTGRYQKIDLEGKWYAPLGTIGGNPQLGSGVQLVLGFTAKSGFVFGDAGPFFTELYSMGGTQFGIPLRGYDEFSITPNGFDASASSGTAQPDAFGRSFAAFTMEFGARISQSVYLSTFMDAGNVYRSARQYDPSRLFRGAGFGAALITPLGPIGVDLGYGFNRVGLNGRPDPGWKVHFKLGNFF
ncbi:MAG: outer membrane protein assembly factor BamA [Gemmatimonadota bacterium]